MIRRQIIEHSIYSVESGRLHNASQLIGAHLNERDAVIYPQLEGGGADGIALSMGATARCR